MWVTVSSIAILTCTVIQLSCVDSVTVLKRRDWLKNEISDTQNQGNYDIKINVEVVNKAVSGYTRDISPLDARGKSHDIYDADEQSHEKDGDQANEERVDKLFVSPNDINSLLANPPPHDQVAQMARFIVRESNWTSMATISNRNPIVGYPFANVFSISDGPIGRSTGVPYMYLTPLDMSVIDLLADNRASLTMSLAQSDYCAKNGYDPEDPRCAHVILTGRCVEVLNSTKEYEFAKLALLTRHPEMKTWPHDHGWFYAKLNISNILLLDYFGGANSVTPEDYFKAN